MTQVPRTARGEAPIGDWLREHWQETEHAITEHLPHHHDHTSAETPAAPATIGTAATQEEPVSQLSDELHAFASRVEKFDDSVLSDVEAIQGNPKTAEAFGLLRGLTGVSAEPVFDAAVGLLRAVTPQAAPAQAETADGQPQPVPAGPQVAGQA